MIRLDNLKTSVRSSVRSSCAIIPADSVLVWLAIGRKRILAQLGLALRWTLLARAVVVVVGFVLILSVNAAVSTAVSTACSVQCRGDR